MSIYVMGDIHGCKDKFDSVIKQINLSKDDTLYIIGDVVDRGPNGTEILLEIMTIDNIKMLLGNHEEMMMRGLGYPRHDDSYISYKLHHSDNLRRHCMMHWLQNGGHHTLEGCNSLLEYDEELFFQMLEYLDSLPLNIDIEVKHTDGNMEKFKLIHAAPIELHQFHRTKWDNVMDFAVWDRECIHENHDLDGYTIICGHTPVQVFTGIDNPEPATPYIHTYESNGKKNKWIDIDTGAVYPTGRLTCVRLDDMKYFYSK